LREIEAHNGEPHHGRSDGNNKRDAVFHAAILEQSPIG
jgi:hypothetical protein